MVELDPEENDRRAMERVRTEGNLPSELVFDVDTDIVQISIGGMTVKSPMPLEIGSEHRFTLGIDGERLEVSGVVRHCEPVSAEEAPSAYRVGVEYGKLSGRQEEVLEDFVKKNRED